jgi:lipopolysaccharide biosynthesis protein
MSKARIIAIYLPQFHPIKENNEWWGKGFTEWTNVGKAKPLFKGHYQPKVPSELGYYDLRMSEVRESQASLAKEHGIEGFCYWHYWFGNGKVLLEKPFQDVLKSGKPDFPFSLAWANHSWENKTFNSKGDSTLLIEQLYPGVEDYKNHFYYILDAFKDPRYIRVNDKPIFLIHAPASIPDAKLFIETWQELALENGLKGIYFIAGTEFPKDIEKYKKEGYNAVNLIRLFHVFKAKYSLLRRAFVKLMRLYLNLGRIVEYRIASEYFIGEEEKTEGCFPSIFPNWDHSPRSERRGHILHNSTPQYFYKHVKSVLSITKHKNPETNLIFLRCWNEWGEGNYIEPDLKWGRGYLESLKKALLEENNNE